MFRMMREAHKAIDSGQPGGILAGFLILAVGYGLTAIGFLIIVVVILLIILWG